MFFRGGPTIDRVMNSRAGISLGLFALVSSLSLNAQQAAAGDRLRTFNHWSFAVNQEISRNIIEPSTGAFERYLPLPVRRMLGNAYDNLLEPMRGVGFALDGEAKGIANSSGRFVLNSTLGLLGTADVARQFGMPGLDRTFSQAVCKTGLPLGSYLVLPVFGPTTTGVATAGSALMVGSMYALSLISIQLVVLEVGVDLIATAASLQNVLQTRSGQNLTYANVRRQFFAELGKPCRPRSIPRTKSELSSVPAGLNRPE